MGAIRAHLGEVFRRPRAPHLVLAAAGPVLGAAAWHVVAAWTWGWTVFVGCCVAFLAVTGLLLLARPDARRAASHGYWMATLLLLATWGIAYTVAILLYRRNLGAGMASASAEASLVKDLTLLAGAVGGLFALYRSAGTRSASSALLLETQLLRDHLRRNGALLEYALIAHREVDSERVLDALHQMLREAKQLPATSPAVDLVSLWLKDRENAVWYMLADTSGQDPSDFGMDVVPEPTPGAGMLVNMDADGVEGPLIVSSNAHRHAWWKENASSRRREEGFAGILLRDVDGQTIGALCLTTQIAGRIPAEEELREILQTWGSAFTLGVESLLRTELP